MLSNKIAVQLVVKSIFDGIFVVLNIHILCCRSFNPPQSKTNKTDYNFDRNFFISILKF